MVSPGGEMLDSAFQTLADPTRRAVVERLCAGPASVSELAKPFDMTLAAVVQRCRWPRSSSTRFDDGAATRLVFTEQGVYFEGRKAANEDPMEGTTALLKQLEATL